MKYRSDIDGLRALAVIPVVLYHAGVELFSGGYVGVDIFFVISGYLITSIINEEIKQDRFTISRFYERRIRRIFPALFSVIFISSIAATFIMFPDGFKNFGESIIAATLFAANIFFWLEADYFAAAAETKPLLHTWSLSVEEQFYLFFPLLLLFNHKFQKGRWKQLLLPIALISLLLSIWGMYNEPEAVFYLIQYRAWELLLGSFLALGLFPPVKEQHSRDILSIMGLILILWSVFSFNKLTPFPGAYALIPCIGAALIIYSGEKSISITGKLLSHKYITFIGLISYSLYLWHWPIIVFARQLFDEQKSPLIIISIILLSLLLSVLSWKYIEQPFRKKGLVQHQKTLFSLSAAIMLISIISGYSIYYTNGWSARMSDDLVSIKFDLKKYNSGSCFLSPGQKYNKWQEEDCFIVKQRGQEKTSNTLLWGDSFAAHYIPGLKDNRTLIDSNILQYTASGCAPVFEFDPVYRKNCKKFSGEVDRIITDYTISTIILAASWDEALEHGLQYEHLKQTINTLRAKGLKVIVIGQSPRFIRDAPDIYNKSVMQGKLIPAFEAEQAIDLIKINSTLQKIAGADHFLNPAKFFCNAQLCRFKDDNGFYFWDEGHFTVLGSKKAANFIFSSMK